MNRGRDHVIRGLTTVDVVVGMYAVAGLLYQVSDDLVRVHIGRRSASGLENVHHELRVVVSLRHALGGGFDSVRLIGWQFP